MENESPRQQKRKRRILPAILLTLCFFISAAAGALLASSGLFDVEPKKRDIVAPVDSSNHNVELIKGRDKTTVLIMGVDVREDDKGRSDTMMVATVDPKSDSVSLLSVPRDTRVRIYGYGYDKINAAWAYGG